jgi:hypothetical protein
MPGFRLPERIVEFEFEGEYEGAVIRARVSPIPMGTFLEITSLLSNADAASLVKGRDMWVGCSLVDWNLTDVDGTALPADETGAAALSLEIVAAILSSWAREVADLPVPLLRRSGAGATSEALPV